LAQVALVSPEEVPLEVALEVPCPAAEQARAWTALAGVVVSGLATVAAAGRRDHSQEGIPNRNPAKEEVVVTRVAAAGGRDCSEKVFSGRGEVSGQARVLAERPFLGRRMGRMGRSPGAVWRRPGWEEPQPVSLVASHSRPL
jgi:hypothetical protein